MTDVLAAPKRMDWADDDDSLEIDYARPTAFTDADGFKILVEYRENDAGQRVKITRKIKSTLHKERVNKSVAERKRWQKFGQEKGNPAGPDVATTTVGEQIMLKLSLAGNSAELAAAAAAEAEEAETQHMKDQLKGKKILCRICKGDHFTTKCPYKDTLQPLDEIDQAREAAGAGGAASAAAAGAAGEKSRYVAPHMRGGGGVGDRMGAGGDRQARDDSCTLRVTNLSEDTRDADVHDLFRPFGQIARVFLAKDRETFRCKGFAFVSFVLREDAAKALEAIDGHGYDSLILRVEWSQPAPNK